MENFNIIQSLLARKIYLAHQDALPYVQSVNSNKESATGLDVSAPFRLYSTFGLDKRHCLASLASVPYQTVERWIRESGTSSTRLQAPLQDVNAHSSFAAHRSPTTERSGSTGPPGPHAFRQFTPNLWQHSRCKVEKGYFTPDCPVCFKKGYGPKSEKQLRSHLGRAEHTRQYKIDPTPNNGSEVYRCCDKIFDGKEPWVSHVVRFHCHCTDTPSGGLQGVSTPGSSSGRYAGENCYQGTPSSGVTRNTSVSGTESCRCSGVSGLHEGSPKSSEFPVSFEDATTLPSEPNFHLKPPYLPQTVASTSIPNEQFPLAVDGSGNVLLDYDGNQIFRTYDSSLVSAKYGGLIPIVIGQPLFAYEDSGKIHNYWYGTNIF
ncbi:hypothetical protein AA0121_g10398 [Alternaria tenuissima]|nr:hypothetical protein AA0118_g10877 [Alternaria tenuissima]RYO10899.1 hypothetical protein AA0121_g10398 [Alternaria tenuissima]